MWDVQPFVKTVSIAFEMRTFPGPNLELFTLFRPLHYLSCRLVTGIRTAISLSISSCSQLLEGLSTSCFNSIDFALDSIMLGDKVFENVHFVDVASERGLGVVELLVRAGAGGDVD
jgi:hypothetical protein